MKRFRRRTAFFVVVLGVAVTIAIVAFVFINGADNIRHAEAAASLGINQVFIKNNNNFALADGFVSIPISFRSGEYYPSGLRNVKIGSFDTQVTPTSYYKNNSVRTAVARVLASVPANSERIYDITTGANPDSFTPLPEVTAFLNGGLKSVSRDLGGGTYFTVFRPQDATLVEDGPVVKTYEFVKRHRPVNGCSTTLSQTCLPYFFTSKFWVTVVRGKPYVEIKHFIVNFGNLSEDTWTPGGRYDPYDYAEGQNGSVFYKDVYFDTTTGTTPSYLHIIDQQFLDPSVKQIVSDGFNRFIVMPENGQNALSDYPYWDGPSHARISDQSNFIMPGQGLLTYAVLHIGSASEPAYSDPFEESNIESGQSLARFNQVSGHFFEDIVIPTAVNSGFDMRANAEYDYNRMIDTLSDKLHGHRFGDYDYNQKDMGGVGFYRHYEQDPDSFIKFLMSCDTRCAKKYLDITRFHTYGSAQVASHAIGFDLSEHMNTDISTYRNTSFEKAADMGSPDDQCGVYCAITGNDKLGFCPHDINAPPTFRQDKNGVQCNKYSNSAWLQLSHKWTSRDAAHASLSLELYRWMFTADYAAFELGKNQVDTIASSYQYTHQFRCDFSRSKGCRNDQTRARGRALINIAKLFNFTGDEQYRTLTKWMVEIIDNMKDHSNPGYFGQDATGHDRPVKFFDDEGCGYRVWYDMQPLAGLAVAYQDTVTDIVVLARMRELIDEGLFFLFNYAVRKPSEVVNSAPNPDSPQDPIAQGPGGWGNYQYSTCPRGPDSDGVTRDYPVFNYRKDVQSFPGMCLGTKVGNKIGLNPDYLARFQLFFRRSMQDSGGITNIGTLNEEEQCGLRIGLGLPNALEQNNCQDSDGDGHTTCGGDCNDLNRNVYPATWERCSDGIDNNCNGLIDCEDVDACAGDVACSGRTFCGDQVITNPNDSGFAEQCDVRPYSKNGANPCSDYYCVPAGVAFTQGCFCAGGGASEPPAAPTNLLAPNVKYDSITLHWEDNADNESGYFVERKTDMSSYERIITINRQDTVWYVDQNVLPDTIYTYRVAAFNDAGASLYSNEFSVATPQSPISSEFFPLWSKKQPDVTILLRYDMAHSEEENGSALISAISSLTPGQMLKVSGVDGKRFVIPSDSWLSINKQGTSDRPIWIEAISSGSQTPTIARTDNQNVVLIGGDGTFEARYVVLRGFNITGGKTAVRIKTANNVWLDKLNIYSVGEGGVKADTNSAEWLYVTRNRIHDTGTQYGEGVRFGNYGITVKSSVVALNNIYNINNAPAYDAVGVEIRVGSHSNLVAVNAIHNTNGPCILVNAAPSGNKNFVMRNIVYSCGDNGIQLEGRGAWVINNIMAGQYGNKAFDNTHGDPATLEDIIVRHNTIISGNGYGASLWAWDGQPNLVFANNVVYVLNCRTAGYTIKQDTAKQGGLITGNVVYNEYCDGSSDSGTSGVPPSGYIVGRGLSDFKNIMNWDGSINHDDFRPSFTGAIIGSADPAWKIDADFTGNPTYAPYEAGAFEANVTPTPTPTLTPTPGVSPSPTPTPTGTPMVTPTPTVTNSPKPSQSPSSSISPTPSPPPTNPPAAPTNLFLGNVTPNRISLFWTDKSTNEDGFVIERSVAGGTFKNIASVTPDSIAYNDFSVGPNQVYTYRVYSYNLAGRSEYSNEATITTPPLQPTPSPSPPPSSSPPPEYAPSPDYTPEPSPSDKMLTGPENLRAQIIGRTTIYLTWTATFSGLGLNLEVSTDGITFSELQTLPYYYYYWKVLGAIPGITYHFRMRAYDNAGYSEYSNVVSVAVPELVNANVFTKPLYRGLRDAQVTLLQAFLAKNSAIYPERLVTGYFGSLTQAAVRRFQAKYGIINYGTPQTTGYGHFGPKTRAKANELYFRLP